MTGQPSPASECTCLCSPTLHIWRYASRSARSNIYIQRCLYDLVLRVKCWNRGLAFAGQCAFKLAACQNTCMVCKRHNYDETLRLSFLLVERSVMVAARAANAAHCQQSNGSLALCCTSKQCANLADCVPAQSPYPPMPNPMCCHAGCGPHCAG